MISHLITRVHSSMATDPWLHPWLHPCGYIHGYIHVATSKATRRTYSSSRVFHGARAKVPVYFTLY